jgi:hypothetical protein
VVVEAVVLVQATMMVGQVAAAVPVEYSMAQLKCLLEMS